MVVLGAVLDTFWVPRTPEKFGGGWEIFLKKRTFGQDFPSAPKLSYFSGILGSKTVFWTHFRLSEPRGLHTPTSTGPYRVPPAGIHAGTSPGVDKHAGGPLAPR